MAEAIEASAVSQKQPGLIQRIAQNPVVLKELRGRMRGGRAFVILTIYLILTGALVSLVFFGIYLSSSNTYSAPPDIRRLLGKAVFFSVAGMELMMVCFIAPALTAGAISTEREHQTYDLLRTTLLSARSLVFGKLFSALSFIWLLLFTGIPLLSLAYLFGGVAIEEVLVALLILFVSSIFFSALGLFYSSFMKRTLGPTVLSYASAILIVFGLPTLVLMGVAFFSATINNPATIMRDLLEVVLLSGGWLLLALNPLGAAVGTEVILMNNQSIIYTNIPLSGGNTFLFISPWIGFTFFYLVFSVMLVMLSVAFVRRAEK